MQVHLHFLFSFVTNLIFFLDPTAEIQIGTGPIGECKFTLHLLFSFVTSLIFFPYSIALNTLNNVSAKKKVLEFS